MPSPFPGMDPFLEGQRWQDFHARFVAVISELLMPQVRPRYVVEVQEYVYLARQDDAPDRLIEPDVAIVEREVGEDWTPDVAVARSTAVAAQPRIHTVPVPKRYRQAFLTIRTRESQHVVTVIELLSPWNKSAGEGRAEYLVKRTNIYCTLSNLVELDLLRGGERLPTRETLTPGDYYAFVSRKHRLPKVEVYAWTLAQPLPTVPVPLAGDDPDAWLNLQAAFSTTYDRAGYDYALDYRREVEPSLEAGTAQWVRSLLTGKD